MKIFITKYALTDGITEAEADVSGWHGFATVGREGGSSYYRKPYWHATREEAVRHAESLRIKKLASLQKQIATLKDIKF